MRDALSRALNVLWPSGLGLSSLGDEYRSIERLFAEGNRLAAKSPIYNHDHREVVMDMVRESCEAHGREPHENLMISMCVTVDGLMEAEGIIPTDIDWALLKTSFSYKDTIRRRLESRKTFFSAYERNMEVWHRKVVAIFAGLLSYFPDHAFRDEFDGPQFSIPLTDTVENLGDILDRILATYDDEDVRYPNLSREMRELLTENLFRASGVDPHARGGSSSRLIIPSEAKDDSGGALVSKYLTGTPYDDFLSQSIPFAIPEKSRFEHCHILGGTGHGKTQLMQQLILADLEKAQTERRSVVVIDSQGDLIHKLSRLRLFGQHEENSLSDKFCLIDPSDIDCPVALNMFAVNRERLATYGKAEREKVLNGTVELYENFFGSLLGAELTQKQGVIFRYLARLMLEIPNANIHTLRDLMDDATPFIPYMEKLSGSARYFFEREFFDRSFAPTKKQIAKRLWGVLATPSFERMFAQTENKIDMFDLLNSGSVVLISTAKDLLKQEGCELFGRFFLSLIAQAAMERSVIAESKRTPTSVFIDEAQEYFDDSIDVLLAQGRKYKIGLVCGNQTLDQLTPELRASFMSNTGTKVVGGLSAKDAHAFASEMHTDSGFLQSLRKRETTTEFALYVRHQTPQALRISVPLGLLEREERLTDIEYDALIQRSRERFGVPFVPEEHSHTPFRIGKVEARTEERTVSKKMPSSVLAEIPKDSPRESVRAPVIQSSQGRGGREHKYLQELVKGLAEQQGFLARIEEEVLDGDGFVDVALTRGEERIACEIAITTPVEREVANIVKCLEAGFVSVWVISPEPRHLAAIRRLAEETLPLERVSLVTFLKPDELPNVFLAKATMPKESVVRGYKVRVRRIAVSQHQDVARRNVIGEMLVKSVSE